MKEKMIYLYQIGLPKGCASIVVSNAFQYQKLGGIKVNEYWKENRKEFDELMILSNIYLNTFGVIKKKTTNEKRLDFDWFYMFQLKQNLQTVKSIYCLIRSKCYFDAAIIIRSLQSRLLQLLFFSINPKLSDEWAKDPEDNRFRESNIRKNLRLHGIEVWEHIYKKGNNIVHGNWKGLGEYGLFTKGIFPDIQYNQNLLIVCAKYFIGISAYVGFCINQDENLLKEEYEKLKRLFAYIQDPILANNRIDHLPFIFKKQDFPDDINIVPDIEYANFDFNAYKDIVYDVYK